MELRISFVVFFILLSASLVAQDSRFGSVDQTNFSVKIPFFYDGIYIIDLLHFSTKEKKLLPSVGNLLYASHVNFIFNEENLEAILNASSYFDIYGNKITFSQAKFYADSSLRIDLDYAIVEEGVGNVFVRYELVDGEEMRTIGVVELTTTDGKVFLVQEKSSTLGYTLAKTLSKNALYRILNRNFLNLNSEVKIFTECLRPFPDAGISLECVFGLISTMTLDEKKSTINLLDKNN